MIQGLHSTFSKLTAQVFSIPPVGACFCGTDRKRNSRLAKIGSQGLQTQNPVTYREAKTLLHSRYYGDWKKENSGYQAHLDPIWRLEWAQQTTIFIFAQGTVVKVPHLKRIGISDTSLRECRQADQTPVLPSIYWETSANMASGCWPDDQALGLGGRPLPDSWICGIDRTEDVTCMAVYRRRRS